MAAVGRRPGLVLFAVAVLLGSVAALRADVTEDQIRPLTFVALLAIVLGEQLPMRISGRVIAPLTTAPALGFILTPLAANGVQLPQAQAAIKEEFAFFADWSERYQYLIDLGRKLPPFPDAWKTEEHRLLGCQSLVWIVPQGDAQRLDFHAISDSAIVSGLIFLALRVYSGRSAAEILATEPDYIADIGLARHLSPTRSNGLAALLAFIRDTARRQA